MPLPDSSKKILNDMYKIKRKNCEWVFPRKDGIKPLLFRARFVHALKVAEIENFTLHDLRHTTASYLAMQGASLREIAEVLNHKTLQTTQRYAHISKEHTQKLLNKLDEEMFGG